MVNSLRKQGVLREYYFFFEKMTMKPITLSTKPNHSKVTVAKCRALKDAAEEACKNLLEKSAEHARNHYQLLVEKAEQEGRSAANQIIRDAEKQKLQMIIDNKAQLAAIAITIAEEVVGEYLCLKPEAIATRIERALLACKRDPSKDQPATISVHPDDLSTVEDKLKRLSNDKLTILSSPLIEKGDALIETDHGTITVSPFEHLQSIKRRLHEHNNSVPKSNSQSGKQS